jgi:hypothetical protein
MLVSQKADLSMGTLYITSTFFASGSPDIPSFGNFGHFPYARPNCGILKM